MNASKDRSHSSHPHVSKPLIVAEVISLRNIPQFIPAHDLTRGILHTVQVVLMFAFMLAAM